MVTPARFERATFPLGGGRSIQLSYGAIDGAALSPDRGLHRRDARCSREGYPHSAAGPRPLRCVPLTDQRISSSGKPLTSSSSALICTRNGSSADSGSALGPSQRAWSG